MSKEANKSLEGKVDTITETMYKIDKDLALQHAAFMEHLRIHDRSYEEFKRSIDILEQNTQSLREHMHRTELLEELVNRMDGRLTPIEKLNIETEAVKKHKHEILVRWGKIIAVALSGIGILVALKPLIIKLLI